jgi:hypothetical protein
VWALHEFGIEVASDFLPQLLVPYHIAENISFRVGLGDQVGFAKTILILEDLGYEIEARPTNDFCERNLTANYREFAEYEILRITRRVLKEMRKS